MGAVRIRPATRALDAALGTPWAIQAPALDNLLTIASRQHEVTSEALEAYRAEAAARGEQLEQRGDVAILRAHGPFFRRANLFTELSGASSYEMMRRDLQAALDDPQVRAILLDVDSPGGEVNGCGELAKAINAARGVKPVVAYVGGTAASAAYWLASAASEVVVDDAAVVGSIGCVIGLRDTRQQDAAKGVRSFEFVSSQTPLKHAEPDSEAGASEYQRLADDTAQVFIEAVARHRGRTPKAVIETFGAGGVLIGSKAVAAGMADRVGTFEETLARLRRGGGGPRALPPSAAGTVHEAVLADRARYSAILALPEAKGREAQARHVALTTDLDVEAARALLATAGDAAPAALAEDGADSLPGWAEAAAARLANERYAATPEAQELGSRLAGVGLGGSPKFDATRRVSLADKMRERLKDEGPAR